jgi:membrane protein YqaA with SNARE-associated domain
LGKFVHSIQALALTWGAPGILLVALLDSSVLSLPEIADLLVIYMVTAHPARFALYVVSATLGSLAGCLLLYYIGKGGEELLKRRISTHRYEKTLDSFRRHGIMAVLVPSLLPPPAPFKPFVLLAGVAEISPMRFTTAILIGRGARYLIEGLLALWYGRRALTYMQDHGVAVALGVIAVVVVGFLVYLRVNKTKAR